MPTPSDYRDMAQEQLAASETQLSDLDLNNPTHKILIGFFGRFNATLFRSVADILEVVESASMTPAEKMSSRAHKLRMASIRGDQAAIDRIIDEEVDERSRQHQRDDPATG